jgi:N utilization substance protein A
MNKVVYDQEMLGLMALFEKVTHANLKDCFYFKDKVVFLVDEGEIGRALGKDKANVARLEKLMSKRFKITEYSSIMTKFVINIMAPLRIIEIKEELGVVTVSGPDEKTRGLMIGSKAQNLREYEKIVQKYFPELKEIKVI